MIVPSFRAFCIRNQVRNERLCNSIQYRACHTVLAQSAMSFLECPSDPETLAEALAFVDGFDFSGDDHSTDECSNGCDIGAERHVSRRRGSQGGGAGAASPEKFEKDKSRRKSAMYSARLRAKKKNEMQQLREQVTQLQMQLERLRKAKLPWSAVTGSDRLVKLKAMNSVIVTGCSKSIQAYQRQQAEKLNAQLKALLGKVVNRSRPRQDAFRNLQSLGCEIKTAAGAPSTILMGASLRGNDVTPLLGESALCSLTPLSSDMDAASRLIWRGMQLKGSKCCKYHVHRLHVNASAIAKSFFLTLGDDPTRCTLHGAAFARKFEETDRILYIWTTAMVPSQQESGGTYWSTKSWKLRIREKGWAMLSRSLNDLDHESVFRTFYEISSELGDVGRTADPTSLTMADYDRIGNAVVNLLSGDLRKFHERIQNNLLADTSIG
ncbi:unnamed protein product [Phytophthora fragariaefolia]|uniref:Unnamed protein product n=1 Tax=Phytophthora fragariaefolia TaxID=1490495 RepID=A0A9W7D5E0_9STRA|nr:unnamed protein product [Phytophthora fragariaefolia]